MSTDSNIPVLGRIAAKINPDPNNYANGRDYYGSPVHTVLERELDDPSWPKVREKYLFDAKGRLTKFPHNKTLSDAEERDLPATFFYEVIQFIQESNRDQEKNKDKRDFPTECASYYDVKTKKLSDKARHSHTRRMFFSCYAFILIQEIVKQKITVDQLKSVFNDPLQNNGIVKKQHDSYIDKIYNIYCKNLGRFSFDTTAFRLGNDYGRYKSDEKDSDRFNRKPVLHGPVFMTEIFDLNFGSNSKKKNLEVDFSNADFSKNGNTKKLDLEKGGCKDAAVLFVFCAAAEQILCCSPLAKVEELARNAQDISNFLLEEAIMPNVQQLISEFVEKLIEAIDNEKNGATTRFQASGLFNDIQAFINDADPDEPDGVDEPGSLHIVIPNESLSLSESVIELKFHFFDVNKQELSFHYIESYSCDDEFGKPSDGYYFMPGSDNSLPESDYLSCGVKVGTVLDPEDETTAHVVAILYQP